MTRNLLRLELEVEPSGESVQLDLALGEESVGSLGGGLARSERAGGGEHTLGQQTSQVSSLQHGLERLRLDEASRDQRYSRSGGWDRGG